MEILKAIDPSIKNIDVAILGTREEPYFRATDIATFLGIQNIFQNISKLKLNIEKKYFPYKTNFSQK